MNQRPEYDVKQTGRNLRRLRLEHGYTAEQVREYIGIGTVQAVYKWERGDCFPTLDNFFALVELYHVRPFDILARDFGDLSASIEWETFLMARPRYLQRYCVRINDCKKIEGQS